MKHISILTLLLLNLLTTNILAQKNELRLDLRYWPVQDGQARTGAALSYFRGFSAGHLLGAKINFDTDALGLSKTDWRHYALNMDLVMRGKASGKGGQCYADLGLSVLGKADRIQPGTYIIECATGMTEAQLQQAHQVYEDGTTGTDFHLGLATAVGLDVRVAPRFLMGISTAFNLYRINQSIQSRFNPSLSLTRQF